MSVYESDEKVSEKCTVAIAELANAAARAKERSMLGFFFRVSGEGQVSAKDSLLFFCWHLAHRAS